MSSTLSDVDEYSKYSAFDGTDGTGMGDSTTFAIQSKTAIGSVSLADVKFDNQSANSSNNQRVYSRDEFLYALSSPSSIGALAWIVSSFVAVIYGSSIVVYLNFCIPLLVGPYVIKEQMPVQLLPSTRRKFLKLRSEANALAIKNIQLKGTVSRLQRQEYRLSAAEERFEHLCRRNEKDVVKMKQLARKNAALRQKIKVNEAGKKLQESLMKMLSVDYNGQKVVNEKQIHEIVCLMKVFAGKNVCSKFDNDAVHKAVTDSIAKNVKTKFISNFESDTETRESEGDYYERKVYIGMEGSRAYSEAEAAEDGFSNMDSVVNPSQQSIGGKPDSEPEEESRHISKSNDDLLPLKLDPSGNSPEDRYKLENFRGVMQTNLPSGTADRPIDIEKLLFHDHVPKMKEGTGYHYSE